MSDYLPLDIQQQIIVPYFPIEIWEKVLAKLPSKALLICMSVCKDWKSQITDQSFIQKSANNSNNNHLFLQFSWNQRNRSLFGPTGSYDDKVIFRIYSDDDQSADHLSVSRLEFSGDHDQAFRNNFIVIGTCNGLVCLSDSYSATFILVNPFIKRYLVLPKSTNGPLGSSASGKFISGFGFDSKSNDFVVVRIFLLYRERTHPSIEVFSLKARKWRSITGTGLPLLCISRLDEITVDQTFVNGTLNWLLCVKQFGHGRIRYNVILLSFDLATNRLKELLLPQDLDSKPFMKLYLLRGGNSLGLVHKASDMLITIWVMKEYGNVDSWNIMSSFISGISHRYYISRVIAMRNSGGLVVDGYINETIFLHPKEGFIFDLSRLEGLLHRPSDFADIGESLFLLNEENSASLITNTVHKQELDYELLSTRMHLKKNRIDFQNSYHSAMEKAKAISFEFMHGWAFWIRRFERTR